MIGSVYSLGTVFPLLIIFPCWYFLGVVLKHDVQLNVVDSGESLCDE